MPISELSTPDPPAFPDAVLTASVWVCADSPAAKLPCASFVTSAGSGDCAVCVPAAPVVCAAVDEPLSAVTGYIKLLLYAISKLSISLFFPV